jgi:hypothetical protein
MLAKTAAPRFSHTPLSVLRSRQAPIVCLLLLSQVLVFGSSVLGLSCFTVGILRRPAIFSTPDTGRIFTDFCFQVERPSRIHFTFAELYPQLFAPECRTFRQAFKQAFSSCHNSLCHLDGPHVLPTGTVSSPHSGKSAASMKGGPTAASTSTPIVPFDFQISSLPYTSDLPSSYLIFDEAIHHA